MDPSLCFENSLENYLRDENHANIQEMTQKWWYTVANAYSEPQRHYHTMEHIKSMLQLLESIPKELVKEKQVVMLAIFFHDIIYDPKASDGRNELESISLWQEFASEASLPQDVRQKVSTMIEATIKHAIFPDAPPDLSLFLDLDLEVLARPRERYKVYASQIREEYGHYSVEDYCKGRTTVLQHLRAGSVYFTDYFQQHLSSAAVDNLTWEIKQLAEGLGYELRASFFGLFVIPLFSLENKMDSAMHLMSETPTCVMLDWELCRFEPGHYIRSKGDTVRRLWFPGTRPELAIQPGPAARRPPHLPFRRISMPSVPSPATLAHLRVANVSQKENRVSVASQQSTDSLPEGRQTPDSAYPPPLSPGAASSPPKPRRTKSRPSSLQPPPKATTVSANLVKRRKVLRELLDTEKTYVEGLELINEHFLGPLIRATTEGTPLLSPGQMSSIFSNFVDMLGFHQSFYATLNERLGSYARAAQPPSAYGMVSPLRTNFVNLSLPGESNASVAAVLAQHVPFFSMYTPFVTAYPTIMASLHNLTSPHSSGYSAPFALWLKEREQDPRCGKLGLRVWLLTLVQRCPRYLLLTRDLVNCTDSGDPELVELEEVVKLLERINSSLNSALQTQSITLQLLAIQKATPNLPVPFIEPGRTFIRRGSLFQVAERIERLREFFLFSDCIIWLSRGGEREGGATAEEEQLKQSIFTSPSVTSFAPLSRRQSEIEPAPRRAPSSAYGSKLPNSLAQSEDEKWWFRGKIDLLDLEIVLPVPAFGEEGKIEVHSPQMSFAVFCDSNDDREAWAEAIRSAKQARLISMNSTNPNSTLTSSTSNQHLRLALQALPYAPDDEQVSPQKKKGSKKDKSKGKQRRGHVEHFVPAIWVPDAKAEACMRCGGVFGWRRRRHHCRLCGKCVCANCSGKTFFITSHSTAKDATKPARACNACYEAVFPVLEPEQDDEAAAPPLPHYSSIGTLTALPFSRSTPSLALPPTEATVPRPSPLQYELPTPVRRQSAAESERPKSGLDFLPIARPRMPGSRPTSEIRSSSYTTSTMASSAVLFDSPNNRSSITMPTLDSPSGSRSPLSSDSPTRPRPAMTFSTPNVALHTTPVTTRVSMDAEGKMSRYSMVLGGQPKLGQETSDVHSGRKSLEAGLAAGKLADLLIRK